MPSVLGIVIKLHINIDSLIGFTWPQFLVHLQPYSGASLFIGLFTVHGSNSQSLRQPISKSHPNVLGSQKMCLCPWSHVMCPKCSYLIIYCVSWYHVLQTLTWICPLCLCLCWHALAEIHVLWVSMDGPCTLLYPFQVNPFLIRVARIEYVYYRAKHVL